MAGLPCSNDGTLDGLVPACTPEAILSACPNITVGQPAACLFGQSLSMSFGSSKFTMPIRSSHILDLPSSLASEPSDIVGSRDSLTVVFPSLQTSVHCPGSFRPSRYQDRRCR